MLNDQYLNQWKYAIDRTRKFGLSVDVGLDDVVEDRYLSKKSIEELPYVVRRNCGNIGPEELVGQCMSIHHRLAPVISDWLKCDAVFTLGWIEYENEKLFKFDEDFIKKTLKDGHDSSQLNIHAWIALPSMEIIDFSLSTTFGFVKKRKEMFGGVIASHADELKGIKYRPMLVGEDYLRKTGVFVEFQFIQFD